MISVFILSKTMFNGWKVFKYDVDNVRVLSACDLKCNTAAVWCVPIPLNT